MVRNLTQSDFLPGGEIALMAGQAALIVMSKQRTEGIDPILCSVIGDQDEVEVLLRLHRMDPSDPYIRYIPAQTQPDTLPGVFEASDLSHYIAERLPYVRMYTIELKDDDVTMRNQLAYIYGGFQVDGFEATMTVFNRHPKEYDPEYIAPRDLFALFFGGDKPIGTLDDLVAVYEEQQTIANFQADTTIEGRQIRFCLELDPPEPGEELGQILLSLSNVPDREEAVPSGP